MISPGIVPVRKSRKRNLISSRIAREGQCNVTLSEPAVFGRALNTNGKSMKTLNKQFLSFLALGILSAVSAEIRPFNWVGTEAIRAGDYNDAIEQLLEDTAADSINRWFKLGVAHTGLRNYGKAVFYFRYVARHSEALLPSAYERIGNAEVEQKRYANALAAYRTASEHARNQRHEHVLYRKMHETAKEHRDELGSIAWLEELLGEEEVKSGIAVDSIVAELVENERWDTLDAVISDYCDTSIYRNRQCAVCSVLDSSDLPDSTLRTETLYALSIVTEKCSDYSASSDWLHKALDRKDFKEKVNAESYTYHRAGLNYNLRNYHKSIEWYKKFMNEYKATSLLVYRIARCYRSLGEAGNAGVWYDKHVTMFPHTKRTHDILWYRAWQKEDAGNYHGARVLYKKMFEQHRNRSRSDNAAFRYALSYVKENKHAEARSSFRSFSRRHPDSRLIQGANYWEGICLKELEKEAEAKKTFREVISYDPTDYYAYRARERLREMGDTTATFDLDTVYDVVFAEKWLDSISSSQPLSSRDSLNFEIGRLLASVGDTRSAEYFLEPIETCYPRNLLLQYRLAALYRKGGDPTLSYRVARRFAWRIPFRHRERVPLALYSVLYPFSFADDIARAAAEFGVDPILTVSIIRQESIFDPQILSPVGAVGLMQIMPYTGEEIAGDLGEKFELDSLTSAPFNIRYGTHYIGKLLNQFSGDHVLAIAGYNGGPHNAKRWRETNKNDDFDMFIEDIGFTETRIYVKKVLANYWTYSRLATVVSLPGARLQSDLAVERIE